MCAAASVSVDASCRLVVPVVHIRDINDPVLERGLVEHMTDVAQSLGERDHPCTGCGWCAESGTASGDRCCFHVPPYNSIDHLHLHVFKGSYSSCWAALKHHPSGCKWWTKTPESVLAKL